jgi:hypothetical protein
VLHVFGEVFVEECISEDEENFGDFGCFLPILQNVGHAQIEYFLHVVDGDGDAAQILNELFSFVQSSADVLDDQTVSLRQRAGARLYFSRGGTTLMDYFTF